MSGDTYKILTSDERAVIEKQLLLYGCNMLNHSNKAAIYLAEKARENSDDVLAYGYLLKAIRLEKNATSIPEHVVQDYRVTCERVPKEYLRDSYEGCLLLSKELFALNETERAIFYLSFAANSEKDKRTGCAARLMADHLTDDYKYAAQQLRYERMAAKAGNADLIRAFVSKRASFSEASV